MTTPSTASTRVKPKKKKKTIMKKKQNVGRRAKRDAIIHQKNKNKNPEEVAALPLQFPLSFP